MMYQDYLTQLLFEEFAQRAIEIRFDKSGSMFPSRVNTVSENEKKSEFLTFAASLESVSEHPLAKAILKKASEEGIQAFLRVSEFSSLPSMGISGKISGKKVVIGNEAHLKSEGVSLSQFEKSVEALRSQGQTVLFQAVEGTLSSVFGIQDPLKPEAKSVVEKLKSQGLKLFLASGDHGLNTQVIASKLGIEAYQGGLSPTDKAQQVQVLQSKGETVAFLGDGINDAPALIQADIGIAMGTGTDIAKQSAAVNLVQGDLVLFEKTLQLSREMMKNIRQNLFWAFSYNLVGIPLAAGLFYPIWGFRLNPVFSSLAMTASSLLVIGNSLRLGRINLSHCKEKK
ncbi:HAD family hydrolase [bacterium]|nr:HAD family hydrolase [bacterium]